VAIAAVKGGSMARRPLPPALSGGLGDLETAEDLCDIGPLFHARRASVSFFCTPVRLRLWDAASGRFNPVALRAAIVCRGWTVRDFASTAGISRACLYNVLRRHAASDRTIVRVAATLASREPLHLLTAE
jgi:lambda repressor-like predicted transcriptional regulator